MGGGVAEAVPVQGMRRGWGAVGRRVQHTHRTGGPQKLHRNDADQFSALLRVAMQRDDDGDSTVVAAIMTESMVGSIL